MNLSPRSNVVVAITGASGAVYAIRLLQVLAAAGRPVHLTMSPAGAEVLKTELGISVDLERFDVRQLALPPNEAAKLGLPTKAIDPNRIDAGRVVYHHFRDYSAPIASGSFLTAGMVICPCSMGTLAGVANGLSTNLIQRAADVHLKERRKLIVVPRETPLTSIALDNMKRLSDAGAVVLPAMPGFYHRPASIADLVNFVVGRICDQLEVVPTDDLMQRWGTEPSH